MTTSDTCKWVAILYIYYKVLTNFLKHNLHRRCFVEWLQKFFCLWEWLLKMSYFKKEMYHKKECTISSWIRLREFLFQTATVKWNYWQSNTEREFYDWIGYFSLNVTKEIKLVKILWKLTSLNVTCRSPSFASIKSFIQFKNDLAGFHPNLYRRFGIKLKYPQLWS